MNMEKDFNLKNKRGKTWGIIFKVIIYFFAVIGFFFVGVFVAMKFNLTNERGGIDSLSQYYNTVKNDSIRREEGVKQEKKYWETTPEWQAISAGLLKDKDLILKASIYSGVSPRFIVSNIIAEQFRFFNSNRESFKKYFLPLGILGNGTQFSYGVAGIKTNTAIAIENNLKDKNSPYYLGFSYENILDFTTPDVDAERMTRLTDPKNHYYSYLYTGLFIKEVMAQWQNAGYPINNRPEIIATIFNIGFNHSNPKVEPQTGGTTFAINGYNYTFGGIAYEFYYSNELIQEFPN